MPISRSTWSGARPLGHEFPRPPVPAVTRCARGHQVPQAGETGERERLGSQCHSQPRHLGQTPSDQGGPDVVAVSHAVAHSRGQGYHVLHRGGQLDPHEIGVPIGTEVLVAQQTLQRGGELLVRGGDHRGGRLVLRDLFGMIGSGEHGYVRPKRAPRVREHLAETSE